MDLNNLPDLCLDRIFHFLDSNTLLSCYNVCTQWRKIIIFKRPTREILSKSIDVGAEFKNLPLQELTRAKVGNLEKLDDAEWVFFSTSPPPYRYDFSFFKFCTSLTHLELNVELSFNYSEAVRRLRNTLLVLSLGPKVQYDQWIEFWKDNSRLEKLEIISIDTLILKDLPKTLKEFAAVNVNALCLQPCCESLTNLKILKRIYDLETLSFDRLKKFNLGMSWDMPRSALAIEHFEYRKPILNCVECDRVSSFIVMCRWTLTDVIVPGLDYFGPLHPFPNVKRLVLNSYESLDFAYPHNFPALKSFMVSTYHPYSIRYSCVSYLPIEAFGIENLTVHEKIDSVYYPRLTNCKEMRKLHTQTLSNFLKKLFYLKSFEIRGSIFTNYYLKSLQWSNLKQLRIMNVRDYLDFSRFAIELDELKITTNEKLVVKFPSICSIRDLTLEGNVSVYNGGLLIKVKQLTFNSFSMDGDFLRVCIKQGLSILRVDTGKWEKECSESFFETLENGLFAVYASIHKDLRKDFETKIKHVCPSLKICNFFRQERFILW